MIDFDYQFDILGLWISTRQPTAYWVDVLQGIKDKLASPKGILHLISATVLLVGLSASVLIYFIAQNAPEDPLAESENTKNYVHQLELYGGKFNVLMSQFMQWFNGLWHGKTLALPVAVVTVLIAFCFFILGELSDPSLDSGSKTKSG